VDDADDADDGVFARSDGASSARARSATAAARERSVTGAGGRDRGISSALGLSSARARGATFVVPEGRPGDIEGFLEKKQGGKEGKSSTMFGLVSVTLTSNPNPEQGGKEGRSSTMFGLVSAAHEGVSSRGELELARAPPRFPPRFGGFKRRRAPAYLPYLERRRAPAC
jgi:hypothetical protein